MHVSEPISSLAPGTTYHYRVCTSPGAQPGSRGCTQQDRTFTTVSAGGKRYIALGDSLTQIGDSQRYPERFFSYLDGVAAADELHNIGESGQTSGGINGGQLTTARQRIDDTDTDATVVTIDIGGNDLLRCVRGGAQIDTACVTAGVGTVKKNLPTILKRLKAAAGADVPVLVLGYYNPWLAAKALNQPVKGVDAAAKAYTALSTAIESAAKSSGTTFVGLDQAFSTNDTTPTTINGRSVPKNAAAICTLTNICTAADIHLTDEGAATVARVLAKAAQKAGVS